MTMTLGNMNCRIIHKKNRIILNLAESTQGRSGHLDYKDLTGKTSSLNIFLSETPSCPS